MFSFAIRFFLFSVEEDEPDAIVTTTNHGGDLTTNHYENVYGNDNDDDDKELYHPEADTPLSTVQPKTKQKRSKENSVV